MKQLVLHPELESFRKEIEATLKPVVRITTTPGKTLLWQSKFGGNPYLPKDTPIEYFDYARRYKETPFPYPRNTKTGNELYMLAQLNFEEIPRIESFPAAGILQIFMDVKEKSWGSTTDQTTFRIIYYPEVFKDESLLWTDFSGVSKIGPHGKEVECVLTFQKSVEPVSRSDFRFETAYSEQLKKLLRSSHKVYGTEIMHSYLELSQSEDGGKNKLGGYHYSQNEIDPRRYYFADDEPSVLLIQFDGNDVFWWGDGGTACFFIAEKDLKNLDFSQVIYHWDST